MSQHLHHADDGHLLRNTNGHMVNACQSVPAPCFCPANLANSYAITPNLLRACGTCDGGNCSTQEDWDGTFQRYSTCNWQGLNANHTTWPVDHCFRIDGVNLSTMSLVLDPYECQWVLTIRCFSTSSDNTLWQGVKTTGLTPSGTYTKLTGCNGPNTMEVF
jgi:hypothetical protein